MKSISEYNNLGRTGDGTLTTQIWQMGDALELVKDIDPKEIDLVLTDPPYPDYHTDIYKQTPIDFLTKFDCKQIIFWSAKVDFPLDYTAIHIWDKRVGIASQYERIFERNGGRNYRLFNCSHIHCQRTADYTHDTFYNHPSQKPVKLLIDLIEKFSKPGDTIFDPFLGSGSTFEACYQTGRSCIGFECDPKWEHLYATRSHKAQEDLNQWM